MRPSGWLLYFIKNFFELTDISNSGSADVFSENLFYLFHMGTDHTLQLSAVYF